MRIDREYVHKFKTTEYVCASENAFTNQCRIPWIPVFTLQLVRLFSATHFALNHHVGKEPEYNGRDVQRICYKIDQIPP